MPVLRLFDFLRTKPHLILLGFFVSLETWRCSRFKFTSHTLCVSSFRDEHCCFSQSGPTQQLYLTKRCSNICLQEVLGRRRLKCDKRTEKKAEHPIYSPSSFIIHFIYFIQGCRKHQSLIPNFQIYFARFQ